MSPADDHPDIPALIAALAEAMRNADMIRTALDAAVANMLAVKLAAAGIASGARVRKSYEGKPFGEAFAFIGTTVDAHGQAAVILAPIKADGTPSKRTHAYSGEIVLAS